MCVCIQVACIIPPRASLLMPTSRTLDPAADIPLHMNSWSMDYDLPVSLVTNFQETTTPILFRYFGMCPAGSYCLDNAYIQPCPPGTFCPTAGMLQFQLCPPGTYQPRSGSLYCFMCPTGTFCPDYGMFAPSLCPPGWTCSISALVNPTEFCPQGAWGGHG